MLKKIFMNDKGFYNKYKAESLEKIQISLLVILGFILLSVILFTKAELKLTYSLITLAGIIVVAISRHYKKKDKYSKAVCFLIGSTVVISWLPLIFDPAIRNGDFIPIFYLVIPILLASIFVNSVRTIAITFIQIIVSFVVISSSKQLQSLNWISYILFFLIIVIISVINKYMYSKEIEKNILQSQRLKKSNEMLEALNYSLVERKKEVEKAAYYDALTSLGNAFKLKKDVLELIDLNEKFIAIQFDINNFRSINEIYGYKTGDKTLVEIAKILSSYIDEKYIYRWSADKFIALLIDEFEVRLFELLDKIEKELESQIELNNLKLKINFRCGIIKIPEDVNDFDNMLLYLDLTTEKAKARGEENWEIFNDSISHELRKQNHIKETILTSLKNNEFYFAGQPIYDLNNNEVLCLELLIRTELEYNDSIDSMISLAAKYNYILDIDMWVLENVFYHLDNSDEWTRHNKISINLSPQTFQSYSFISVIKELVDKYSINTSKICFEITEHAAFMDIDQALKTMEELKKLGFSLALDDFGVMYSSMSYLIKLPYDYVKIDKEFIRDIDSNIKKRSLVKSLIMLSKDLGIKVIAEGVENESELNVLKTLGVRHMQGFYFKRPYKMEIIKKDKEI